MPPVSACPQLESDLLAWRRRALGVLIWVVLAARSVQFLMSLAGGDWAGLGPARQAAFASLLVLLLGLAVLRDLPHGFRGWFLIGLGYANLVAVFAANGQLSGPLPLVLMAIPIHAGIFLGTRSCWAASGLSVLLLGAMTWASRHGLPGLHGGPAAAPWFAATIWLVVFVPAIFLLSRFMTLLQGLASREKIQRIQLQTEIRERRFLEGALLETSERERQTVGHDLHDGICQQIAGAILQCKVAEQSAALGGAFDARELGRIASILDESLGKVHDLARGLSPGVLTAEALVPALLDLARRTRETHEVHCQLETRGCPERLDPAATTHLYRIAQEAVINAVKHGGPGSIMIRLMGGGGRLVLEVDNDGHGLAAAAPGRDGMGLRIMRYRAEILGGSFRLDAKAGSGVRVRCAVPMARMAVS
jgi:signal transduction histidine kinase